MERQRALILARLTLLGAVIGSAGAAACASEAGAPDNSGNSKTAVTRTISPTEQPTQQLITPTATPEQTETTEPLPSYDEVKQLIIAGFSQSQIRVSPFEFSDPIYSDQNAVLNMLNNCVNVRYGEPFVQILEAGKDRSRTITLEEFGSNYATVFLGECEKLGRATRELFDKTQNNNFGEANRKLKQIHFNRLSEVAAVDPEMTEDGAENYWSLLEPIYLD